MLLVENDLVELVSRQLNDLIQSLEDLLLDQLGDDLLAKSLQVAG